MWPAAVQLASVLWHNVTHRALGGTIVQRHSFSYESRGTWIPQLFFALVQVGGFRSMHRIFQRGKMGFRNFEYNGQPSEVGELKDKYSKG